ncbi:hypothetical protein B0H14DRAFT_2585677 [Mycena olivaceomarginata]|nr:hypothetical protein B0H14DRAFT_2585677 [Mycena olivaceomarginata]
MARLCANTHGHQSRGTISLFPATRYQSALREEQVQLQPLQQFAGEKARFKMAFGFPLKKKNEHTLVGCWVKEMGTIPLGCMGFRETVFWDTWKARNKNKNKEWRVWWNLLNGVNLDVLRRGIVKGIYSGCGDRLAMGDGRDVAEGQPDSVQCWEVGVNRERAGERVRKVNVGVAAYHWCWMVDLWLGERRPARRGCGCRIGGWWIRVGGGPPGFRAAGWAVDVVMLGCVRVAGRRGRDSKDGVAGGARRVDGAWKAEASGSGGIARKLLMARRERTRKMSRGPHVGGRADSSEGAEDGRREEPAEAMWATGDADVDAARGVDVRVVPCVRSRSGWDDVGACVVEGVMKASNLQNGGRQGVENGRGTDRPWEREGKVEWKKPEEKGRHSERGLTGRAGVWSSSRLRQVEISLERGSAVWARRWRVEQAEGRATAMAGGGRGGGGWQGGTVDERGGDGRGQGGSVQVEGVVVIVVVVVTWRRQARGWLVMECRVRGVGTRPSFAESPYLSQPRLSAGRAAGDSPPRVETQPQIVRHTGVRREVPCIVGPSNARTCICGTVPILNPIAGWCISPAGAGGVGGRPAEAVTAAPRMRITPRDNPAVVDPCAEPDVPIVRGIKVKFLDLCVQDGRVRVGVDRRVGLRDLRVGVSVKVRGRVPKKEREKGRGGGRGERRCRAPAPDLTPSTDREDDMGNPFPAAPSHRPPSNRKTKTTPVTARAASTPQYAVIKEGMRRRRARKSHQGMEERHMPRSEARGRKKAEGVKSSDIPKKGIGRQATMDSVQKESRGDAEGGDAASRNPKGRKGREAALAGSGKSTRRGQDVGGRRARSRYYTKKRRTVSEEDDGGRRREGEEGRAEQEGKRVRAAHDADSVKFAVRTMVHLMCIDGHYHCYRAPRETCALREGNGPSPRSGRLRRAPHALRISRRSAPSRAQPHVLSRVEDRYETQTDLGLLITTLLGRRNTARGRRIDSPPTSMRPYDRTFYAAISQDPQRAQAAFGNATIWFAAEDSTYQGALDLCAPVPPVIREGEAPSTATKALTNKERRSARLLRIIADDDWVDRRITSLHPRFQMHYPKPERIAVVPFITADRFKPQPPEIDERVTDDFHLSFFLKPAAIIAGSILQEELTATIAARTSTENGSTIGDVQIKNKECKCYLTHALLLHRHINSAAFPWPGIGIRLPTGYVLFYPTGPESIFPAVFTKRIGSGASGTVFRSADGRHVVKVFKDMRTGHHEVSLLKMCLDDPYLHTPRFHGLYSNAQNFAVVMSYAGTPLPDIFSAPDIQKVEIINILKLLHRHEIHHHDVRAENLMVNSAGVITLVDFDRAVKVDGDCRYCPDVEMMDVLQECTGTRKCMGDGSWKM